MLLYPMPGIHYGKDTTSCFIDVNQEYTCSCFLVFKQLKMLLENRCWSVLFQVKNIADIIQTNDKEVLKNKEVLNFLKFCKLLMMNGKYSLIVKTPYYEK